MKGFKIHRFILHIKYFEPKSVGYCEQKPKLQRHVQYAIVFIHRNKNCVLKKYQVIQLRHIYMRLVHNIEYYFSIVIITVTPSTSKKTKFETKKEYK